MPLAYNKNQKAVDAHAAKYYKLAVDKLEASPLKPYLEKLNKSAPAKKSEEEPVVVSESAAKTTAEDINAKIDTATSTAFEK